MDVLDLLLESQTPLAIERHDPSGWTRISYYTGPQKRDAVLDALRQARRATTRVTEAVDLAFLARPNLGDRGWCPVLGL